MSVAIATHGLSKAYRDGPSQVDVLRGVQLEVAAGEIVAVTGPSGSGKSTLLHLLGGLDRPDTGSIVVGDRPVHALNDAARAVFRLETVGFVFQFHQLLPDFTALENVMLPGRIAGQAPEQVERAATALLEEVGLEDRLGHFPNQLSGGECQRVALCRALLMQPPLLLATSPPATSIRRARRSSWSSFWSSSNGAGPRLWWSLTTRRSRTAVLGSSSWKTGSWRPARTRPAPSEVGP